MKCGAPLTQYTAAHYHYRFRVDVLGEKNVGKTSLIEKLVSSSNVSAALGSTTSGGWIIGNAEVVIDFRESDVMHASLDDKTDTAVLVFDLGNRRSFLKCLYFLQKLKTLPNPPPAFLVVNIKDETADREVNQQEAVEMVKSYGLTFIEVSTSTGHNIDKLRKELIRRLLNKKLEQVRRLLSDGQ